MPPATPSSKPIDAPTATPTSALARKPVHLASRQWSCSEIEAGQAILRKSKLEPHANDASIDTLQHRMQAQSVIVSGRIVSFKCYSVMSASSLGFL